MKLCDKSKRARKICNEVLIFANTQTIALLACHLSKMTSILKLDNSKNGHNTKD